tara:strand:+ start:39 stop:1190 length:1152 start_codon:yes stop_codon:yes gene_type:complete
MGDARTPLDELRALRDQVRDIGFGFASRFAFTNVPRNLVIIFVVPTALVFWWVLGTSLELENTAWEPVEAQIIDTGVSSSWCDDGEYNLDCDRGHFPTVRFSWEIDGVKLVSSDYIAYPPNLSSDSKAEQWLENRGIIIGANITGFVNPDDNSEAVLVRQSWVEMMTLRGDDDYLFCCSLCNVPALFLLVSARRMEWAIPRKRRKRYKLVYVKDRPYGRPSSWEVPMEAKELQVEASENRLKSMSGSLSDEDFENYANRISDMELNVAPLEGGNRSFTIMLSNLEEATFEVGTYGELIDTLKDNLEREDRIETSVVLFLDESKAEGRLLEFKFNGEYTANVTITEYLGNDLIRAKTLNIYREEAVLMEIIRKASQNGEKTDDK